MTMIFVLTLQENNPSKDCATIVEILEIYSSMEKAKEMTQKDYWNAETDGMLIWNNRDENWCTVNYPTRKQQQETWLDIQAYEIDR